MNIHQELYDKTIAAALQDQKMVRLMAAMEATDDPDGETMILIEMINRSCEIQAAAPELAKLKRMMRAEQ